MNQETAGRILGVELPTTRNHLKTAYKNRALLCHPDRGGSKEDFQVLEEAFRFLSKQDDAFVMDEKTALENETIQGDKLSDLGLGLGPTTNGKPCPICKGNGYTEYHPYLGEQLPCPHCEQKMQWDDILRSHILTFRYKCLRCAGKSCKRCKGEGWFEWTMVGDSQSLYRKRRLSRCNTCHGQGFLPGTAHAFYHTCHECKGKGELECWNPVLPKGLLSTQRGG